MSNNALPPIKEDFELPSPETESTDWLRDNMPTLTADEQARGNSEGERIDVNDDFDGGDL